MATASITPDQNAVVAEIFIAAPPARVFQAISDPAQLPKWWGQTGLYHVTKSTMDVRPGGKWRHLMHGPDGVDYKNESIYLEVIQPERLVYQHISAPGFISTVTFEDLGDKTKVNMHMLFETAEIRDTTVKVFNAIQGLQETLQRLADQLAVVTN